MTTRESKRESGAEGAELGRRIAKALKDVGKTQVELANYCGVTPQAITGWLKTGRVKKGKLSSIAKFTNRNLDYFLSEKPNLTGLVVAEQHTDAVRTFLSANGVWRELWLAVVKKNDARLARIVDLYERANEDGKKMILNGARGAALLPRENDDGAVQESGRKPHRKRS